MAIYRFTSVDIYSSKFEVSASTLEEAERTASAMQQHNALPANRTIEHEQYVDLDPETDTMAKKALAGANYANFVREAHRRKCMELSLEQMAQDTFGSMTASILAYKEALKNG